MMQSSYYLHQLAHICAEEPPAVQKDAAEALCAELRRLFCNDVDCFTYQLDVRVFGSVCNNTHLASSDADIAVIPVGCRTGQLPAKGPPPEKVCDPLGFRQILLGYLKQHYGERLVCEQRKALLLCGEGARTQADIVVLIPKLWQHHVCPRCGAPQCSHGYELRSSCERERAIATWPEQHRDNARAFDAQTGGQYKKAVRAAKGLLRSGHACFPSIAPCVPPILIESLFARVPAAIYAPASQCPYRLVKEVLKALSDEFRAHRARRFLELSDKRDLFDSTQTWTYSQVQANIEQIRASLR